MPQPNYTRRTVLKSCVAGAIGATLVRSSDAGEVVPLRGEAQRKSVSFKSGGQTCYGMVHAPGTSFGRSPGVLLIHDLVDAAAGPHRMFVTLADALADAGMTSLRFSMRGRGDSDGASIDITPHGDLEDAQAALALLLEQPNLDRDTLILLGHGWGGVLAALLADSGGVKRMVLLSCAPADRAARKSPPIKPLDTTAGARRVADIAGNLVAQEFFDATGELTPASVLKKVRRPVLLVHGNRDELLLEGAYERFTAEMRFADVDVKDVLINGADHAFTNHEWERQAIEATVAWLRG